MGALPGLNAVLYTDSARDTPAENWDDLSDVGVRWDVNRFGLQRAEITIKAKSRIDALNRYKEHHGRGLALFDGWVDRPLADGYVYEINLDGLMVQYVMSGAPHLLEEQYDEHTPAATDDTDVYLKTVLTNHAPRVSSDQTNIAATGITIGATDWEPNYPLGAFPREIIEDILKMGTSTDGQILDFWLVPSINTGGLVLAPPKPYLQVRQSSTTVDWRISMQDIVSIDLGRNIWDYASHVEVYQAVYDSTLSALETTGSTSMNVTDTTGMADGMKFAVWLDDGSVHITTINGAPTSTIVTITDGLPSGASSGNKVSAFDEHEVSGDTTYGTRYYKTQETDFSDAMALAYANLLLAIRNEPKPEISFVVGSPFIRNVWEARFMPARMLINPGYIIIEDLDPVQTMFSASRDGALAFRIEALDYDHKTRKMRVTPETFTGDRRLDALLQRMEGELGQGVSREEPYINVSGYYSTEWNWPGHPPPWAPGGRRR